MTNGNKTFINILVMLSWIWTTGILKNGYLIRVAIVHQTKNISGYKYP